MTEISPLRRRMTEDITVRNLSPATQRSYISAVSKFSRFFGRSPDKLTLEDVRTFQVHLVAKGMSWPGLSGNFIKNPGNPRKIRGFWRRDSPPYRPPYGSVLVLIFLRKQQLK